MPARRPRLLFLTPLPPPMGGIATWSQSVLHSPLADRFELRVVNSAPSEVGSVSGGSRLRLDRVRDALRALAALVRELLFHRPDLLHVNTSYFWAFLRDGLAVWLASLFGVRTVLHFRGGDFPEFVSASRPLAQRAILATLRRADRLFALTDATREYLERVAGPERVRYVPNFIELEEIGAPPDRAGRSGPVEILFVGWIIEAKGVAELLEAAAQVPGARFTLVGPAQPGFLAHIQPRLDALGERVRLLPARPRGELMKLYQEADVFVLPTWREGFPNVVLEAMAWALPVVATPVGAIPDVVRDGCEGSLVPARDASALAAALTVLVADAERRLAMGRAARARVEEHYTRPVVLAMLARLYDELLAGERIA